jgi:polyisoprenoid-binding protein YceI
MRKIRMSARACRALIIVLACAAGSLAAARPQSRQYRIDAKKSRFIVETQTSGLSSMFSHDHKIEVGDFGGTAAFAPGVEGAATLEITARADSLRLVDEKNPGERQAVEAALREDVLETARFPEIAFKSRSASAVRRADGTYDLRITGELRLHGVRREVTIPARVSLQSLGTFRAIGTFDIRQTDFGITPFSFVGGTVTIKDTVTISFDMVGNQPPGA